MGLQERAMLAGASDILLTHSTTSEPLNPTPGPQGEGLRSGQMEEIVSEAQFRESAPIQSRKD